MNNVWRRDNDSNFQQGVLLIGCCVPSALMSSTRGSVMPLWRLEHWRIFGEFLELERLRGGVLERWSAGAFWKHWSIGGFEHFRSIFRALERRWSIFARLERWSVRGAFLACLWKELQ